MDKEKKHLPLVGVGPIIVFGQFYGQEYIDYCKKVNRCIPWIKK